MSIVDLSVIADLVLAQADRFKRQPYTYPKCPRCGYRDPFAVNDMNNESNQEEQEGKQNEGWTGLLRPWERGFMCPPRPSGRKWTHNPDMPDINDF